MRIIDVTQNGGDLSEFHSRYEEGIKKGREFAGKGILPYLGRDGFELDEYLGQFLENPGEEEVRERAFRLFHVLYGMVKEGEDGDRYLLADSANMTEEQLRYWTEMFAQLVIKSCTGKRKFTLGAKMPDFESLDPTEIDLPDASIEFWLENPELLGAMVGMLQVVYEACVSRATAEEEAKEILTGIATVALSVAAILVLPPSGAAIMSSLKFGEASKLAVACLADVCISVAGTVGVIQVVDGTVKLAKKSEEKKSDNVTKEEDRDVVFGQKESQPVPAVH